MVTTRQPGGRAGGASRGGPGGRSPPEDAIPLPDVTTLTPIRKSTIRALLGDQRARSQRDRLAG
eukprot:9505796-Alexandrium_andersonii.AAC.1